VAAIQVPRLVFADGHPRRVHVRAGGFAVEGVVVAGAGDAAAQDAAVIGKAAVCLDDGLRRPRDGEHALHSEVDAVERRAPDYLAHVRQHDHIAA